MISQIASALKLKYEPVVMVWTDEKPHDAMQFTPGRWGCVMAALAAVVEKGRPAVFDKETYGCWGGGVGFGFGDCYQSFPGGPDCFEGFLSDGNDKTEKGKAVAEACAVWMKGAFREEFLHGERYRKTPEQVKDFVQNLPMMQIPTRYVVLKRLSQATENETIASVIFFANADQMSALVVLANYDRSDSDGAVIPHAAGCQSIGIFTYAQNNRKNPSAIVGLNDPSARLSTRRLGHDLVTVSLPWKLFVQMESNVKDSFLTKEPWTKLTEQEK